MRSVVLAAAVALGSCSTVPEMETRDPPLRRTFYFASGIVIPQDDGFIVRYRADEGEPMRIVIDGEERTAPFEPDAQVVLHAIGPEGIAELPDGWSGGESGIGYRTRSIEVRFSGAAVAWEGFWSRDESAGIFVETSGPLEVLDAAGLPFDAEELEEATFVGVATRSAERPHLAIEP